jgi:hypothetical protein
MDYENAFVGYLMGNQKDLADSIAVLTNTIPGITLYPQYIQEDITVPSNYDGVTFSRGIDVGYTVTIAPGSILTWGGEDPINIDQVQVTTNITVENFSGNYDALLSDASKAKRNTGAAATFTIDTVANVGWTVGDTVTVINEGSGAITLTAASGVTFVGDTSLTNGGGTATLVMTSADNWVIAGAVS